MNKVLQEIIDLLDVEPIEENLFRGQNHNTEHVFGGQVLAQALASAFRTVTLNIACIRYTAIFCAQGTGQDPFFTRLTAFVMVEVSAPAGWQLSKMVVPSSRWPVLGKKSKKGSITLCPCRMFRHRNRYEATWKPTPSWPNPNPR